MADVISNVTKGIATWVRLFLIMADGVAIVADGLVTQGELGRYHEQLEGATMGSSISPTVANIYMEDFELKALNTSLHPQVCRKRYVDDTFVAIKSAYKNEFLEHINSIDEGIQFTVDNTRADASLPFLDILEISQ